MMSFDEECPTEPPSNRKYFDRAYPTTKHGIYQIANFVRVT